MSHARLVRYDAMCRAISAAHAVDEVKAIRDKVAALELYARQAGDRKLEQRCREIRERAERRWGQLYTPQVKARGAREKGVGKRGNGAAQQRRSPEVTALREMGVTKRQSQKWQARATVPEDQCEQTWAAGKSTDPLLKKRQRQNREAALAERTRAAAERLGRKFYSVIYADPPWRFEPYSRETGMDRAADNHYPTMTIEQLRALKIPAAKDAVLFLWTTAAMLDDALSVMKAWGFAYKSNFV
jgi:hypothetical protein